MSALTFDANFDKKNKVYTVCILELLIH